MNATKTTGRQFIFGEQSGGRFALHDGGRAVLSFRNEDEAGKAVLALVAALSKVRTWGIKAMDRLPDDLDDDGHLVSDENYTVEDAAKYLGRDPERRKLAAKIIRGMRNQSVTYTEAVVGGCWAGALMGR